MCEHHGHCEHIQAAEDTAHLYNLYKYIDMENLVCLNERVADSGKKVFKPFEERKDSNTFVESDVDEELLFNIPFTGSIKLKGIIIAAENGETHPASVAIFKNRSYMTFDDTNAAPDQCLELHEDPNGEITYPLKVMKFGSVQHLSLHFKTNFGGETTRIHYIGLRGDFTEARRKDILIANYELRPNIADHKTDLLNQGGHYVE
ncbi:hypothetical protein ACTXT7_005808 [Hymenolepis weldensis]